MTRCEYAPVYKVTRKTIVREDIGVPYTGYGISCRRKDPLTRKYITRRIDDISTKREMAFDMAELFNKYCLSPDCFESAVVDIIS